jgi:hypothetical protein
VRTDNLTVSRATPSIDLRPIAHGDFNGDGYQDLALGVPGALSPRPAVGAAPDNDWYCSVADASLVQICQTSDNPTGPYSSGNSNGVSSGMVFVLYGSASGYQTPVDSGNVPIEIPSPAYTCSDYLGSCTSSNGNPHNLVYGSIAFDSGSGTYTLDTTKTACTIGSNSELSCKSSIIYNPQFFNPSSGNAYRLLSDSQFGASITVADVNHDGIDDLVVGQPRFSHLLVSISFLENVYGALSEDALARGAAFIYYGAKNSGIVAPPAKSMLGDSGLGITGSGMGLTAATNRSIFLLSPQFVTTQSTGFLDYRSGNSDLYRNFSISLSAGDFNADGNDDLAAGSVNGQTYVFYGPLCQVDNMRSTWATVLDSSHLNRATASTEVAFTGTQCTTLNLNQSFPAMTTNNAITLSATSKNLLPQSFMISGITKNDLMGSVMHSDRPRRQIASTTIISNPGNINGDPEGTSDLILGTYRLSDSNFPSSFTGIGYLIAGHKKPVGADMPTNAGLFVSGSASYNGSLNSTFESGKLFYNPVLLRPHNSDGSNGGFFYFETSLGDLNGDGTADLLMPTQDVSVGVDGTPVIKGGGFRLVY